MFLSVEDARQRIEHSIVLFGGCPVYIESIRGDNVNTAKVSFYEQGLANKTALLPNKKWQFKAPPLGYVNHNNSAVYLLRQPVRRWKQGLDANNLFHVDRNGDFARVDPVNILSSLMKPLAAFREAIESEKPLAISSQFALDQNGFIYRKGVPVGILLDVENKRAAFSAKYNFVKEAWMEVVNAHN